MRPFLFILVLALALVGIYALFMEGQKYYRNFAGGLLAAMLFWLFIKYGAFKGPFFDFLKEKPKN